MAITPGQDIVASDFINKAQANVVPSVDVNRVPKLENTGQLDDQFINFTGQRTVNAGMGETMDGTSTPLPVFLKSNGNVYRAQANAISRQGFSGFVKNNITVSNVASFLNEASATGESVNSFVANAGNNRVAYVTVFAQGGAVTVPASVTYNGNAMTLVDSIVAGNLASSVWSYPIGSNGSADAAVNIVASAFVGTFYKGVAVAIYQNANQSIPVGSKAKNSAAAATSVICNLTPNNPNSLVMSVHNTGANFLAFSGGQTGRISTNAGACRVGDVVNAAATAVNYGNTASVSTNLQAIAFEISSGISNTQKLHCVGIVDGFTDLVAGAVYYVSDTIGIISTTVGTNTIKIGRALSTTVLLISE